MLRLDATPSITPFGSLIEPIGGPGAAPPMKPRDRCMRSSVSRPPNEFAIQLRLRESYMQRRPYSIYRLTEPAVSCNGRLDGHARRTASRCHGATGLSIRIGPPCSAIDSKTARPPKRCVRYDRRTRSTNPCLRKMCCDTLFVASVTATR